MEVSRWIDQQIQDYPNSRFIITSLPFGYRSAHMERVGVVLEMQPFERTQIQQFIQNWYLQSEIMSRLGKDDSQTRQEAWRKSEDLIKRINNSPSLVTMTLNPLLLTMIATVHSFRGSLPERRVELYAEICDVLLGRRRDAKGIPSSLNADQKKGILQLLALELMKRKTVEFTPEVGNSLIQSKLATMTDIEMKPEEFFHEIENVSGLLVQKEKGVYEFAHKSFQEYLAAVQIKQSNQEYLLSDNISDSWWDETIRLYAAQSDTTDLICAALLNPNVVSLKIALDCEEEGLELEPEVRQHLKDWLQIGLESPEPEIAKLAAQVKLARRLSKLLRIDENLEIDTSYITCAEYQLFIDAQKTGEFQALQPNSSVEAQLLIDAQKAEVLQPLQPNSSLEYQLLLEAQTAEEDKQFPVNSPFPRFTPEDAKKPITGISFSEANGFCAWLTLNRLSEENKITHRTHCYRLPTESELDHYPAQDDEWLLGTGIRIARFQVPSRYTQLCYYLASGQWKEADKQTTQIMLQLANRENHGWLDVESIENFPCTDLSILDQLWVQYSSGHFGFTVQKRIWESIAGKLERYDYQSYEKYGEHVGWYGKDKDQWYSWEELNFSLDASEGHLPALHTYLRIFIHTHTISSLAQRLEKCTI